LRIAKLQELCYHSWRCDYHH